LVAVISCGLLDGCCYVLVPFGGLLSFPKILLDGCRFFPAALQIIAVFFWHVLNGCSTREVAHNHA